MNQHPVIQESVLHPSQQQRIQDHPDNARNDECGKKKHPESLRRRDRTDRRSQRNERSHRKKQMSLQKRFQTALFRDNL